MGRQEFLGLKRFVESAQYSRAVGAKSDLWALIRDFRKRHAGPDPTLYRLMLRALSKRMGLGKNTTVSNAYLSDDGGVPQIELFDTMALRFPLITESRNIANAMLNDMLPADAETFTLFSIGIGSARQEADFLNLLANRQTLPRHVQVVGLEPSLQSLNLAERTLMETADVLGLSLQFTGLCQPVECLKNSDWKAIRTMSGPLLISESFALHHTGLDSEGREHRDEVLRQLKALNPLGFVLIEPNSDHVTADLDQRFENCWSHFALVFQVIDRLDVETEMKEAIKRVFFGREIEDIIALGDRERHERHETVAQWQQRLDMAGFMPWYNGAFPKGNELGITTVKNYGTYIGLDVVGQTVVVVIGVK